MVLGQASHIRRGHSGVRARIIGGGQGVVQHKRLGPEHSERVASGGGVHGEDHARGAVHGWAGLAAVCPGGLVVFDCDGIGWEAGRCPRFHGHESRGKVIVEGGAWRVERGLGDSVVLLVAGDNQLVSESHFDQETMGLTIQM